MKRFAVVAVVATCMALPTVFASTGASADSAQSEDGQRFVVLYADGASADSARAAIAAAGGTITGENTDVGVATVVTGNQDFTAAIDGSDAIAGTAADQVIGSVPQEVRTTGESKKLDDIETEGRDEAGGPGQSYGHGHGHGPTPTAEPLADLQWDMQQIGATVDGSYRYQQGKGVKVGIIDTGVDASHPDIAPNFDAADSRNFTVDLPFDADGNEIDGSCESDPDGSCEDPATVDEDGHGTHVASTIASPLNGLGIAGVAPQATIVNLRAGQDAGYFFLKPSLDALTYAGNHGIDVVNMSYYVDPWLFNCTSNPADTPAEQESQRTIITAMQRALDYAWKHGVTLVSAAGNGATDFTKVLSDASSPDYAYAPGEEPKVRDLLDPESCVSMPSEGNHVISISSTGPSLRKAYYSDYGNGYIDFAAPGGDAYDSPDNRVNPANEVLAAYPESIGRAAGTIDANGDPTTPFVVKSCDAAGTCAYYQYLQGTSMAAPHAVGVAALIIGKYGHRDHSFGGKALSPRTVEQLLKATATRTPCPDPRTVTYTRVRADSTVLVSEATCEGNRARNGFYGRGVVNALLAVKGRR